MKRIVILGAGGQARELRWTVEAINEASPEPAYRFLGFVVTDLGKLGQRDSRDLVLGDYSWLRARRKDFDALALGIGTPAARLKVASELASDFGPEWWPSIVHPSAVFDRSSCKLGPGVFVSARFVGTVNIHFGEHSMANFGCTIGHESEIGRGCVVNPGANISGGVVLEDGVQIGTGAQVLQYLRVGKGASVGAGAVVTKDVPGGETVVGIPAKPLKRNQTP